MEKPLWMWAIFLTVVTGLLIADLGFLNRDNKQISIKESFKMSAFYISAGLLFGVWIHYNLGAESAKQYLTGFLVEKTLSLDNIFIMSMIFNFFTIPNQYQHRVLFWGILGVIILRGIMIGLGATLVAKFSILLHLFAVFLIITGIKMLIAVDKEPDINDSKLLKLINKYLPVTPILHGNQFFIRKIDSATGQSKLWITPLLVSLILVEFADLIFALDSVPAIFTITTDPYIIYTSNIFAILGLRALYFALAATIDRFHYLKYSLAIVLIFIGSKMFIAEFLGLHEFPASLSLGITCSIIAAGIGYSWYKTKDKSAVS